MSRGQVPATRTNLETELVNSIAERKRRSNAGPHLGGLGSSVFRCRSRSSSQCSTTLWSCVVLGFLLAIGYGTLMLSVPYNEHLLDAREHVQQAQYFLRMETCANDTHKAALGAYNKCRESERVVAQGAYALAIKALLTDMNICKKDSCSKLGINLTDSIVNIVHVVYWGTFLTFVLSTAMLVVSCCKSLSPVQQPLSPSFLWA